MEQQQPSQSTTLAQKADIVAGIAIFPALTIMVFLRRKVGYRFLDPVKLLVMFMILWFFASINGVSEVASVTIPNGPLGTNVAPAYHWAQFVSFVTHAAPIFLFAFAMLGTGMVQRFLRFRDLKKGNSWHTYSRGISWLSYFLPLSDSAVKRFIDPAVVFVGGLVVSIVLPPLGTYLTISAFSLFIFEAWDYERQLNQMLDVLDSQVDSEVMSENVAYYSQPNPQQRPLEETAGIPTGVAPDIAAQIERRKARAGMQGQPLPPQQAGQGQGQIRFPNSQPLYNSQFQGYRQQTGTIGQTGNTPPGQQQQQQFPPNYPNHPM